MIHNKIFQTAVSGFLILIFSYACQKFILSSDLNADPELGIPLLNGTISLGGILEKEEDTTLFLSSGIDDVLHLHLNKIIDTLTLDEIVEKLLKEKGDTLINEVLSLPELGTKYYIEGTTKISLILDSILENTTVDSIKIDRGKIAFTFDTYEYYEADLTLSMPDITNAAGEILTVGDFKPVAGSNRMVVDLDNQFIKIRENSRGEKIFVVEIYYFIRAKGLPNMLHPPEVKMSIYNTDLNYIYGQVGDYSIDIGSIEEILFEKNPLGRQEIVFDLENPDIRIYFINSFGLPFYLNIKEFGVMKNGEFLPFNGFPNPWFVDGPEFNGSTGKVESMVEIGRNSNFIRLISKFPEKVFLESEILLNPQNPDQYNYIRNDDALVIGIKADMPLEARLNAFTLRDTFNMDGSGIEKLSNAKLNCSVRNNFPFDLVLQGFFADNSFQIIDSLFTSRVTIPSSVSDLPAYENPFIMFSTDNFSEGRIKKISRSAKFITSARISTRNYESGQFVTFYLWQDLEFKLIAFGKAEF